MTTHALGPKPNLSLIRRTPHVLLAEDDYEHRTLLKSELEREGFQVTAVADGGELLDYLEKTILHESYGTPSAPTPDIIVSDVRMPGATGIEVLWGLREARWTKPVLLITAFGDEALHERARRLEAEILDKPFVLSDLVDAIRSLVEK